MSSRPGQPLRITKRERDLLEVAQGSRCAICGKRQIVKRLAADHDHQTGTIRALLCQRCNEGIGRFEYDNFVIMAAIAYLQGILDDRGLSQPVLRAHNNDRLSPRIRQRVSRSSGD